MTRFLFQLTKDDSRECSSFSCFLMIKMLGLQLPLSDTQTSLSSWENSILKKENSFPHPRSFPLVLISHEIISSGGKNSVAKFHICSWNSLPASTHTSIGRLEEKLLTPSTLSACFPSASSDTHTGLFCLFVCLFSYWTKSRFISRGSSLGRVYIMLVRTDKYLSLQKVHGTG